MLWTRPENGRLGPRVPPFRVDPDPDPTGAYLRSDRIPIIPFDRLGRARRSANGPGERGRAARRRKRPSSGLRSLRALNDLGRFAGPRYRARGTSPSIGLFFARFAIGGAVMAIERSRGKARPGLPRSRNLKPVESARDPSDGRTADGRFGTGNRVSIRQGEKHAVKKLLGDGSTDAQAQSVGRDAIRLAGGALRDLPSDGGVVRTLVAVYAREAAVFG